MVYFLGTDVEAPAFGIWTKEAPCFYVSAPDLPEMAVGRHLAFPFIRYLGAHTGCGCGFRSGHPEFENADPAEAADTQADHEALVAYLQSLATTGRPMQIYGCWTGDETLPAEHFRTCTMADLATPLFAFRERELITLAG